MILVKKPGAKELDIKLSKSFAPFRLGVLVLCNSLRNSEKLLDCIQARVILIKAVDRAKQLLLRLKELLICLVEILHSDSFNELAKCTQVSHELVDILFTDEPVRSAMEGCLKWAPVSLYPFCHVLPPSFEVIKKWRQAQVLQILEDLSSTSLHLLL